MKVPTIVLALFLSAATANASLNHAHADIAARHASIARRAPTSLEKRAPNTRSRRRCQAPASNRASPSPANVAAANNTPAPQAAAPAPAAPAPQTQWQTSGIVHSDYCGGARATPETSRETGPHGHIDFLNCGIHSGGWSPPYLGLGDLHIVPLGTALQSGDSPFHACAPFRGIFEAAAGEYGVPAIMLASFAMQESSCNPNTVGGGGEQGLMQITQDKCGGAPNGDCRNPDFNIRAGARYFAERLAAHNGNVLLALGQYNGWFPGMTFERATAAQYSACCRCQNNLDYLHQFLNGWIRNINSYNANNRLGRYFNLDVCG
ncbi:hypothetical protein FA15DRAFT_669996 [Coprinopsis marcescibilis]|uniref:Transglycosylase SLT domain-containing protein n=1 Tax=Coprinopsis marcescibilis TaxID=230819 RepID=A0A5C3KTH4_COPMA|nr:hypothetical protein FA15DRAFT_669996 [Coprinopsis marcescibilis]